MGQVDRAYTNKYGNNLQKAIKKEFGGKVEDALLHHVGMILDPYTTIAELIEKTMKGLGTDEYGLSAAIVRYHHIIEPVQQAYQKKYTKTLKDRIIGETSGRFRELLLKMLE